MPYRSKRKCTYPGCQRLSTTGRCDEHKNTNRTPVNTRKLYNSPRWKVISREQLARYPYCIDCYAEGRLVKATECDHVYPHRGDEEKFFAGPFQSLCKKHHSAKTAHEIGLSPH